MDLAVYVLDVGFVSDVSLDVWSFLIAIALVLCGCRVFRFVVRFGCRFRQVEQYQMSVSLVFVSAVSWSGHSLSLSVNQEFQFQRDIERCD